MGTLDYPASKLTTKQARFVREVLRGSSLASAYRQAYSGNCNATTARTEGWRLANRHPFISPLLEAEKARMIRLAGDDGERLREEIFEALTAELQAAACHGDTTRLIRVAKLLGNHCSVRAFDRPRPNPAPIIQTADELRGLIEELENELAEFAVHKVTVSSI